MMKPEFYRGTTLAIRVGFSGFAIAVIGVAMGFLGFYLDQNWLALTALILVTVGVFVGFGGVLFGWAHSSKKAIKGSLRGISELRSKLHGK